MPRLENWSLIITDDNTFMAPELVKKRLQGNVYGHKDFEDGTFVHTSSLIKFDPKNKTGETRNAVYELGEMDKGYLKWVKKYCPVLLEG